MNNAIHLETARAALARSAWRRGITPRYDDAAIVDLLLDLRHLCWSAGIDFENCSRAAAADFTYRKGGAS